MQPMRLARLLFCGRGYLCLCVCHMRVCVQCVCLCVYVCVHPCKFIKRLHWASPGRKALQNLCKNHFAGHLAKIFNFPIDRSQVIWPFFSQTLLLSLLLLLSWPRTIKACVSWGHEPVRYAMNFSRVARQFQQDEARLENDKANEKKEDYYICKYIYIYTLNIYR